MSEQESTINPVWRPIHVDMTSARITRYAAIMSDNRQALVDYLTPLAQVEPFVTLTDPCGATIVYQTADDIPAEDVPSSCGQQEHWFIKYKENDRGST